MSRSTGNRHAKMAVLGVSLLFLATTAAAQIDDVGLHFKATTDTAADALSMGRGDYSSVAEPTLNVQHLQDLPGFTRSVVKKDHALITPESQVWSPLPGWSHTLAAYFITPVIGAHFALFIARMAANSTSAQPSPGVERLAFVISGEATFKHAGGTTKLQADAFAYAPAGTWHELQSTSGALVILLERKYTPLEGAGEPSVVLGSTAEQAVVPVPGEVFVLRKLLPTTAAFDFNIHVMDFQPGEYLAVKEVHYNQHGLLLLEGRGLYRLADQWYPVQAGDVIWMAPFVPQWYAALGKSRSRYFLYKDTNRDPLVFL